MSCVTVMLKLFKRNVFGVQMIELFVQEGDVATSSNYFDPLLLSLLARLHIM